MAPDQPNRFACSDCGTDSPRSIVSYDSLGYPICPHCGTGTRPRSSSDRRAAIAHDPSRTARIDTGGTAGSNTGANWLWGTDRPAD